MIHAPGTALTQAELHGTFSVERDLVPSRERVFAAYADLTVRRRWFVMPGDRSRALHELDFRVGGHEVASGVFAPTGGTEEVLEYRQTFWDLEPRARIVGYSFTLDGVRRWASLVTAELPAGDGTRLGHTEQYALADDDALDITHLKASLNLRLNGLAAALSAAG